VVVECQHAATLGSFYAELLAGRLADGANEFIAFIPASADPPFPGLVFLQVPEPRIGKNRLHIDRVADDKAAAVARAIALVRPTTATSTSTARSGPRWPTPEGNVFDIAIHPAEPTPDGAASS
jgi:hypothetical protein